MTHSLWLALLMRTESELAHEWSAIGWVVRNRLESSRYPDTYVEVIRQPLQFSAFNDYRTLSDSECWDAMAKDSSLYWQDWRRALSAAISLIMAPRGPFDNPRVTCFWSPRSMTPKGSNPPWAKNLASIITPAGIDPQRFKFGEEA